MPSPERLRAAARAKQAIRVKVWTLLERNGAARFPGAKGRIPNFVGAEAAAERLTELPEWKRARVVKANPDAPQLPVRARALAEGKLVYMAVPRLAEPKPFMLLDPDRLKVPPRRAASIRGAPAAGRKIAVEEMRPVDLVVCGSVAVNRKGVRVGKGGGFSDLEFAFLVEAGLITDETTLVTTVHPLQLLDEELPETDHDFRVGRIVTPDEVIGHGKS
jgi:5-formyltetrahydrofolate cyclo-ligase